MAKQKMKISKTVKDRFKVTKGGKILHAHGGLKHRRSKETTSLKLRGKKNKNLTGPELNKFSRILSVRRKKSKK